MGVRGDVGLVEYRQCVKPKPESRLRVARAIRPNPTKPAVRFGEEGVVLSWVPQKANGDQERVGHLGVYKF
jgi:hypothetical protein